MSFINSDGIELIDTKPNIKLDDYTDACYSVFVGGTEVNDYYLTLEQAEYLKFEWEEDGYDADDVEIEKIIKE